MQLYQHFPVIVQRLHRESSIIDVYDKNTYSVVNIIDNTIVVRIGAEMYLQLSALVILSGRRFMNGLPVNGPLVLNCNALFLLCVSAAWQGG